MKHGVMSPYYMFINFRGLRFKLKNMHYKITPKYFN
jgi:hypothetical protein